GKILSPIPIPDIEVLQINTEKCSRSCLKDYMQNGLVFSFLAYANKNNINEDLESNLKMLLGKLEINHIPYLTEQNKMPILRIALLLPQKTIRRYSTSSTNTILSYLLYRNKPFELEIFDSNSESLEDIKASLHSISSKGFQYIIALLTHTGANNLNKLKTHLSIYIPSVHSSQITSNNAPNIIYGGISYEEQIQKFFSLTKENSKIVSFYDVGTIGNQIHQYILKHNPKIAYSTAFDTQNIIEFPKEIKNLQSILDNSTIFLNTPITNSSIILSQLTYNSIQPNAIYSTQINYNPSLLSITQPKDRSTMFIANSISTPNPFFNEIAKLLQVDLEYDWINYSTGYGIE
ncbi:MAG: hypothetical protein K2I63_01645, partial [Helicobacter sp.]|nr:hypothetical protein [Helicobacter sp.]